MIAGDVELIRVLSEVQDSTLERSAMVCINWSKMRKECEEKHITTDQWFDQLLDGVKESYKIAISQITSQGKSDA